MSLIVENGTIVAGAESYVAVSDADAYHANRGNAAWTPLDAATKEQKLRIATDHMCQVYRQRWKGTRKARDQALDWPRGYVYLEPFLTGAQDPLQQSPFLMPDNVVPIEVQRACAELALRAVSQPLSTDVSPRVLREKVGPLEVEYDRTSPQQVSYPAVDNMLAIYLLPGGGGAVTRLVRS